MLLWKRLANDSSLTRNLGIHPKTNALSAVSTHILYLMLDSTFSHWSELWLIRNIEIILIINKTYCTSKSGNDELFHE